MKIFLSHSISDKELIEKIKALLKPYKIQLLIAEHTRDHLNSITEKIEHLIMKSDIGLVLLTANGFDSHFVQQEIGYLKSSKKQFIQVVEKGLESKIKGFNFGKDYISYDPLNNQSTLNQLHDDLLKLYKRIQKQKQLEKDYSEFKKFQTARALEVRKMKLQREKQEANAVLAVLAGLLLLGISSK